MGTRIDSGALLFFPVAPEFHLLDIGRAHIDWMSKVTGHYVKDGKYRFEEVRVEDGAWVQAYTRILVPRIIEGGSRVLPGSMILPGERIERGSIWGGIPAAPLGKGMEKRSLVVREEKEVEEDIFQ